MQELRDAERSRRFLTQGLWLQRAQAPADATVRPALQAALELAGAGDPLPSVGFLADVHALVWSAEPGLRGGPVSGLPATLAREYEDLVLGRLLTDSGFERAGDALRRYQGRDRARGLAFLVRQLGERVGGVLLSPAVIRGLLEAPPEAVLAEGWDSLSQVGLLPELAGLYQEQVAAARRGAGLLTAEDVFELEQGTALLELGQRLALRQLFQAATTLEAEQPIQRPPQGRRDFPTHLLDEDIYPVGGYSSVSTRGTIESLLPSQLAYMEKSGDIDLFDVKYVRDELLYYSRDENQFLRRRRTFLFALAPDLIQARVKDVDLPWQRMVLLLGLLTAAVRKLPNWLSSDALLFEFCFLGQNPPLAYERHLLELVFRTAIANGSVRLTTLPDGGAWAAHAARLAQRSRCHGLWAAVELPAPLRPEQATVSTLQVGGRPILDGEANAAESAGLASWSQALARLLAAWA